MTAGQQNLAGSGGGVLPSSLAAGASNGQSLIGNNASGRISLNSDGSVSYQGIGSEVGAGGPAQWAKAVFAGIGNNVYVRCTATSGTITTNPAGGYTLLSSNLQFIKGPSIPDVGCTVTFDFSYDGATAVLTSPGWNLTASHV